MGYYSIFNLEIYHIDTAGKLIPLATEEMHQLMHRISEASEYIKYYFDSEGRSNDRCKWYDANEDLRKISEIHRDLLFILNREGEESPDFERSYFLNGRWLDTYAKLTYPPLPPEFLTSQGG